MTNNFALSNDELLNLRNQIKGMAPKEAIAFLEEKGLQITWDWKAQLAINHSQVFTVAKVMKMDVLEDIRDMLSKSLAQGLSFESFQKELVPQLQAKGWTGRKVIKGKTVELTAPWRMKTIYQTNMQSAYNAGRYNAQEDNKDDRPYLEYIAVVDGSTRDDHAAMDGVIKPFDDPIWNVWYPPNGYNCRCRVKSLTKENYEESKPKPAPRILPDKAFISNPGKDKWSPKKKDYDSDIWKLGGLK